MGMVNTTAIVARHSGVDKSTYAAGMAASLRFGGKSDWFLPSKDELNQMYIQNLTLEQFVSGYYWSSSETDAGGAWELFFADGIQDSYFKSDGTNYFRPVRAF
jgi:hypothetical protein